MYISQAVLFVKLCNSVVSIFVAWCKGHELACGQPFLFLVLKNASVLSHDKNQLGLFFL
jgi:hypothetical protein